MWGPLRKLLRRSRNINALLGDVLFESNPVIGQTSHSTFQWQVKRGLDDKSFYLSVKMRADGSIGSEGSPTNYISFDLATALQVRADIDECIAIIRHFTAADGETA
jgi:hypothetical protein